MRAAIVSTYPPRRCGIATFTTDLRGALLQADGSAEVLVAAVTDDEQGEAGPEVLVELPQHSRPAYAEAARFLNRSEVDAVLIQHEYGIFGGDCGDYLLDLTAELEVPYVVTLHTVLTEPSPQQLSVLRRLCAGAAQVTVFTATGRDILVRAGVAPWDRITVLHHGAPVELHPHTRAGGARLSPDEGCLRELEPHAHRTIVSTFGLLSAGKGVEVAIRSLPQVVAHHPEVLYVVAGRTHPEVARREGEVYRRSLEQLSSELGVDEHVLFVDRFLTDAEIRGLLGRTQVFLTPYRSHEQVVSGVLTFALVAGCPVVSTPYLYAADVLSSGAGVLVPFDDPAAMAAGVRSLLRDPARHEAAVREAVTIGAQHTWPEVGRLALKVLSSAAETRERSAEAGRPLQAERSIQTGGSTTPSGQPAPVAADPFAPGLERSQLARLVDDVGIIQFACGLEPDLSSGYCVDDVARLARVTSSLLARSPDHPLLTRMLATALTFLEQAWAPDTPGMHNFRAHDRRWLDAPHSGDHLGRAVWALADTGAGAGATGHAGRALDLVGHVVRRRPALHGPRPVAYTLLGLSRLSNRLLDAGARAWMEELAEELLLRHTQHRSEQWWWFEDRLTYDNARLPQALIAAGGRLHQESWVSAGLEALEWCAGQSGLDSEAVVLVGNRWRHRRAVDDRGCPGGVDGDEGDEQPLDAAALVEACVEAYRVTGSATYRRRAIDAFAWFHGRNRWGLSVFDRETSGCHDGVGPGGLNANEGAESTLAYWQAHLALESVGLLTPWPSARDVGS